MLPIWSKSTIRTPRHLCGFFASKKWLGHEIDRHKSPKDTDKSTDNLRKHLYQTYNNNEGCCLF